MSTLEHGNVSIAADGSGRYAETNVTSACLGLRALSESVSEGSGDRLSVLDEDTLSTLNDVGCA